MITFLGMIARQNGYHIEGSKVRVIKEMIQEPLRWIGQLTVDLHIANSVMLHDKDRKILQQAAHTCPVLKSLNPDIKVPVTFHWE